MTIFHDKPHNLHIICDSCNLSIFDGNIDKGVDQLQMIHTHCVNCCKELSTINKEMEKTIADTLNTVSKIKDKAYNDLSEGKESTLEDRIEWLRIVLRMYEGYAKRGLN